MKLVWVWVRRLRGLEVENLTGTEFIVLLRAKLKREYVDTVVTHVRVQLILVDFFLLCIRSCLRRSLLGLDRLFGSLLLTALELANDVISIDIKGEYNTRRHVRL